MNLAQITFSAIPMAGMLYLLVGAPPSQSAPNSSIPTVQIGSLIWDQTEMTIGDVKGFASSSNFVSAAEKNGGGLSYEGGFVKKPGWTWKMPMEFPQKKMSLQYISIKRRQILFVVSMASAYQQMQSGQRQHF